MIIEVIMFLLISVLKIFSALFPNAGQVPLLLPWGIDEAFRQGVDGYKILSTAFPPFDVVVSAFLIYIGFKLGLLMLKAIPILGRTIRHS